ncbi:hypothetical protein DSO57_1038259 [Entomophthora muscae]|uniref:Uncharacterized protein n=1 Tax=Entomophthora muscae TaxID=34485 RepID=A0ACC2RPP9_9FUNG|nr:hypothetical protein DSO57_1038259 [Entomophthora muscae]
MLGGINSAKFWSLLGAHIVVELPIGPEVPPPVSSTASTHYCVAIKFPNLPANVSYNTQGALSEPPLDVYNNMDQSDGSIKLRALSPN